MFVISYRNYQNSYFKQVVVKHLVIVVSGLEGNSLGVNHIHVNGHK